MVRFPVTMAHLSFIAALALVLALGGCTDDNEPRDGTGGGPSEPKPTSSGDDDAGTDGDVGNDVGDDAGGADCELEPSSQPSDPRFPCCYETQECRDSNVTGSDSMHCYYAECTEGGQGVCRRIPNEEMRCWDDLDCPEGYRCTIDHLACDEPTMHESPGNCLEDD